MLVIEKTINSEDCMPVARSDFGPDVAGKGSYRLGKCGEAREMLKHRLDREEFARSKFNEFNLAAANF